MDLNEFVVLPNNKAKCIKLNARNLHDLHMEAETMTEESKEMEEKLQQLKESMSKEKEERGHSPRFGWKSGECRSLNSNALTNSTKKEMENRLQKLLAGKARIRVLTDKPLTGPPQPPPPLPPPAIGLRMTGKNRLRGKCCGQCEVRTAGLMCAECAEDYCVGCFTKFHQKGALKLHKMIPIQTDLRTHVRTPDVVGCFQKQINHSSHHSAFTNLNPSPNSKPCSNHTVKSNPISEQVDQNPAKGTEAVAKPSQWHLDPSQALAVNHVEEKKLEMTKERLKTEDERRFPAALLEGEFNEEESARSFQEALRQWRGEKSDGAEESMNEAVMWTPVLPGLVSGTATQADLAPDRGADGLGRGARERRVPVRVEFTENSLTYMDRLLLKKYRRTPIETYPSLASSTDLNSPPDINMEGEIASSLTERVRCLTGGLEVDIRAQEEDFHCYCLSLFAVPDGSSKTEPQIATPEPYLVIEVLDERDRDAHEDFVAEPKTDNRKASSGQQVLGKERSLTPQTALTTGVSSGARLLSPRPIQTFRQSSLPAQPKAAQRLCLPKAQTSKEHLVKSSSSRSMPSVCPTAETLRTSKTLIKTQTAMSQKRNCFPTAHKCKPACGSPRVLSLPLLPHSQSEIPKSSHAPRSFPLDVSPSAGPRPQIPEEYHLDPSSSKSLSLRSTFTVSPSGSTETALLPQIYQSAPLQKGSDSSLLLEQQQSFQLIPGPISSRKPSQSHLSNLDSSQQYQHSLCDPKTLLYDHQLQLPPSPESSSQNQPPKSIEANTPIKSLSSLSLFNESPPDIYSGMECIPSFPSHLLNANQNPPLTVEMKEEEELSIGSEDEMSSDSLGFAPHDKESSDEEAQIQGHLPAGRSKEEEQVHPAICHQEDSSVPADVERENDLLTDEEEQLSETFVVMHKQSAGSGSVQLSDLDAFPPLGLDTNSGHSNTPEHPNYDSPHSSQTSPYDSDQIGSEDFCSGSSIGSCTDKHLIFRMMKDNHMQSAGVLFHSATPTRRGEKSAIELGTSGSNLPGKFPPTLSQVSAACCLSRSTSGSEVGSAFRQLSRAAEEIMEISDVDQMGCEDPDLDADTTTHTLYELEHELRLLNRETGQLASVFGAGNSRSEDQRGNQRYTPGRVNQEQKDEEAAAESDRQSVLLLP